MNRVPGFLYNLVVARKKSGAIFLFVDLRHVNKAIVYQENILYLLVIRTVQDFY